VQERGFARHGIRSALVGRDDAVAKLSECLRRLGEGRGGIVFVLGEAGVGKSRLIAEVRQQAKLEYLEGHSLSYGRAISYWPFQQILRGYTGIRKTTARRRPGAA
jgi:predicted ATPase